MTRILMHGLCREADIAAANEAVPDYIGFEFCPDNPSYLTPERALGLKAGLDEDITVVGSFTDAPVPFVAALLNEDLLDIALFCGQEDESYLAAVRSALRNADDKALVRAFAVAGEADLAPALDSAADMVLLHLDAPAGSATDWSLLQGFDRAFLIAGGLDPSNVADVLSCVNPTAVAVGRGIESDGTKDAAKMHAFANAVHAWDAAHPSMSMLEALHPEYHEDIVERAGGQQAGSAADAMEGEL